MLDRTPKVFISYSWTNKTYQESVIDLASRLRHDGVDVKLDVWDLKEGQDKYAFMEMCVTDPEIDRVLIFSDNTYAQKADQRKGGVGDETTIISPEVYGNVDQQKFIPVVMERTDDGEACLPAYLKTRKYCDLSGQNREAEYESLVRIIFNAPIIRKPEIGTRPLWLTEESPDGLFPLKNAVKALSVSELGKMKDVAVREYIDAYIEAMKQFYMKKPDTNSYLSSFMSMKEYRDSFLDHLKAFSSSKHFGASMADEFERLYNALYNVHTFEPSSMQCGKVEFDIFRLHIWELFVCTITFLLHYEMYEDIHELLVHTYFLRTAGIGNETKPFSYVQFRFHSSMMEEHIKPEMGGDLSTKYTLVGHYVCSERELLPIYSGKAMANADLFLYQVYNGLDLDKLNSWGAWFPSLYAYAEEYDSMWKKLLSKQFCYKIMPVFGVQSIEDLKCRIAKCVINRDYHYSGAWSSASAILSWIKLDDIATLP